MQIYTKLKYIKEVLKIGPGSFLIHVTFKMQIEISSFKTTKKINDTIPYLKSKPFKSTIAVVFYLFKINFFNPIYLTWIIIIKIQFISP